MNHLEAGALWNANAEAWTQLSRAGYDVYRDHLNTPAFLASLPEVTGLHGLDIGCGEGHNTRLVAQRGARMTGIDIAEIFIRHAKAKEAISPLGIQYQTASAVALPFDSAAFDFATGFMSLMDIPETQLVLAEAHRVIRPGGFLQFSILHPCFNPPHRHNCRDEDNVTYAVEVGEYFTDARGRVDEWTFGVAPEALRGRYPKFRVPRFHRPISEWFNLLVAAGFQIEYVGEPKPANETVERWPILQDAQVVAYFLHFRVRKTAR
ncbi:class I SAM-dependent methyltransferase [Oleiharenicola lentus]|uniref:class I SAM-dependent methyltransferase n=1 Tax=Oleiharenicola lentus TaxID=2508720 RepID=UPI003F6812EB